MRKSWVLVAVVVLAVGCREREAPPQPGAPRSVAPALAGVVDPWTWPRAAGASDLERALENIGPFEPADRAAPSSPLVNTNGHYWTTLVGVPWDEDVDLVIDRVPVDLDGDGEADTRVSRRVTARGGVLANPELFGLTRTPDDPRGRLGRVSASTGVLGLREALAPDGRPSGQIGMTCFLCHGSRNPEDGAVVPGLAATRFDYGLLLATARILDERETRAAAYRRARGFPPGQAVRGRLLLAGPGRQDLTGEFGLDVSVPGFHSDVYAGTRRVRQGTKGISNPISVPAILAWRGLSLQNWSGSENAEAPRLERLISLARAPEAVVRARFGLPADTSEARRALLLDLRNLGTLGLQQDSFPGILWADALNSRVELTPDELAAVPPMYAAVPVRRVLRESAARLTRPTRDAAAVARGRELFTERVVGVIANRQILKQPPRAYAAARLTGPILAPIDPSRPLAALLPVRCADCHNASPGERLVPFSENPPPLGRCTHCHRAHPSPPRRGAPLAAIASLQAPPGAPDEVSFCTDCHGQHRTFGPLAYSTSLLLPFDANGDGNAQGDEAGDLAAGGIGTESLLAFDVPRPERPFSVELAVISDPRRPGPVTRTILGVPWVRVPPLLAVFATAPYLHNGSVPTLRALLEPPPARPTTFPLGAAGFLYDTRLPGNRNGGHLFGTRLSPREKDDLIAFLETL